MFNLIRSMTVAPQITAGSGIKHAGNGIVTVGEHIVAVGHSVARYGEKLQAGGWMRRLMIAGVYVCVIKRNGSDVVRNKAGELVDGEDALGMHLANPKLRLWFTPVDKSDDSAVKAAAEYQQKFDGETAAALDVAALDPITIDDEADDDDEPAAAADKEPTTGKTSGNLNGLLSVCDENDLECC